MVTDKTDIIVVKLIKEWQSINAPSEQMWVTENQCFSEYQSLTVHKYSAKSDPNTLSVQYSVWTKLKQSTNNLL